MLDVMDSLDRRVLPGRPRAGGAAVSRLWSEFLLDEVRPRPPRAGRACVARGGVTD